MPDQEAPLNAAGNEAYEEVDTMGCLAETAAVLLGVLGTLILVSGLGFFTVNPPGEADLCKIETLGLQNKTKGDQDFALGACHGLYGGVFNMLHVISVPFILCGLLALISAFAVGKGAFARHPEVTPKYFMYGAIANLGGLIMVAVPSLLFPSLAAIVAAGLAPIHAYFITIMVGHFAVSATGMASNTSEKDEGVRMAAQTYQTLYLGYCAASRTELCLFIGSMCMMALVGIYIFDIFRYIAGRFKPLKYENQACQLRQAHLVVKRMKEQLWSCCACCACCCPACCCPIKDPQYNKVNG